MTWRDIPKPAGALALAGGLILAGFVTPADKLLAIALGLLASGLAWLGVLWRRRLPSLGLSLLVIAAVLAPVTLVAGITLPFALTGLLCGGWAVRAALSTHPLRLRSTGLVFATLAFLAVAILAFLVGQYPWFPVPAAPMRAQLGGLAIFVLSGGLLLVVGHAVTPGRLRRLVRLFLAAGALFVAGQWLPFRLPLVDGETVGSMFWVWLVAIALGQGLFNTASTPAQRVALIGLTCAAIGRGIFLAFDWASGWLPAVVAAGVILLLRFPRTTMGTALLVTAPAMAGAVQALMRDEWYSWMTRLEALRVMAHVIERNPWLGFGPANYYHYTVLFPILGWSVRFNSHNNYVDIVAQTGLIGLAAFAWIVAAAGKRALALSRDRSRPFARAYGIGVVGGIVGSVVAAWLGDWVLPFAYNVGIAGFRSSVFFWLFLGGLLVLGTPARPGRLAREASVPRPRVTVHVLGPVPGAPGRPGERTAP